MPSCHASAENSWWSVDCALIVCICCNVVNITVDESVEVTGFGVVVVATDCYVGCAGDEMAVV